MIIKEFFEKQIDRNIETVIKADDRENISDEVAEYVITKEISKKIRDFFHAYNNYAGANGVWISGFFGSGKSHLLKILSYVLENKEFDGCKSGELFAAKIEDAAAMLKGDIKAASKIPSESVLFNIDQQAQITSKADDKAILSVFYKVFYDHLGFFGAQLHVAKFEQWLSAENVYSQFKKDYEAIKGENWEKDRRKYFSPKVKTAIGKALGGIFKDEASKYENIIDGLRKDLVVSIEDFSQRVQEYLDTKSKGFRLNFFVDEVGQYVSDNTKLMLNLQTIAESLATKTRGNSWILVTSQEDMEKVVGDMNKSQQNDFSRIMARFKIKIPLTSANVDEVIEKRLLKKNKNASELLSDSFIENKTLLDTLLSFSDAGIQFKGYKNGKDFTNKFPFIPYQFDLFQQCRRALSTHNAFQGKHASVGERSMLGVFQQVVRKIETGKENTLVSFDMMFEGIRNELKGDIQNAIILAEKNLGDPFAIRVLKALFMVKYFSNFKSTKRNISVLMIEDIHLDLKEHDQKINEALNRLENQSYVQRSGDIYEFLTDDEKDVENEIKETELDDAAISNLMKEIFFDEIIKESRIRFAENKQDFEFTSRIDGRILGREKELEIEIITENNMEHGNPTFIQSQTMGSSGMKMVLESDALFMKDLTMYLQTHKYIRQKNSASNRSEIKRILQDRGEQNRERKRNLRLLGDKALANAAVYMNGGKMDIGQTADGKTRVIKAFQNLVKIVYPNLKMLNNVNYDEKLIRDTIEKPIDDLFGTDEKSMSESETEILNRVQRRKNQSDRTTLNDLKDVFARKPYGWHPNAIWTTTALLYKRGKLEVKQDSNILTDNQVLQAFLKNDQYNKTILEPQANINPKLVQSLKTIYAEAFNENCPVSEAREVANTFKNRLNKMLEKLTELYREEEKYPFVKQLAELKRNLISWTTKDYSFFLNNQDEFEEDLLDAKEDILQPIQKFMAGDRKKIYNDIKDLVSRGASNLKYVEGEELVSLRAVIEHPKPYDGNIIQNAKTVKDVLIAKVKAKIDEEKNISIELVENLIANIQEKEEYLKLNTAKQELVLAPFLHEIKKIKEERFIDSIQVIRNKAANRLFSEQLNLMMKLSAPVSTATGAASESTVKYIPHRAIQLEFRKTELQTEEDVDLYVEALRRTYKKLIRNKNRITL